MFFYLIIHRKKVKALIFSNLNGNIDVLKLMQKEKDFDVVFFLGGLIAGGIFPKITEGMKEIEIRKIIYDSMKQKTEDNTLQFKMILKELDKFKKKVYFIPGIFEPKNWKSMIRKCDNIEIFHKKRLLFSDSNILGLGGFVLPIEEELLKKCPFFSHDSESVKMFFSEHISRELVVLTYDSLSFWIKDIINKIEPCVWISGSDKKTNFEKRNMIKIADAELGNYALFNFKTKKVEFKNVFQRTLGKS